MVSRNRHTLRLQYEFLKRYQAPFKVQLLVSKDFGLFTIVNFLQCRIWLSLKEVGF